MEWLDLPIPRRLVRLTAPLDDLLTSPAFDDAEQAWVDAHYTDAAPQRDPMRRLQTRFPYCAAVHHDPAERHADGHATYAARVTAAKTDHELIEAFLMHVRNGVGPTPAETEIVRTVLHEHASPVEAEARS